MFEESKYRPLSGVIVGAIFAVCLLFSAPAYAAVDEDKSTAVIFVYQRVGEDNVPQSNISLDSFEEHIKELKDNGYSVLPLPRIIDAVKAGDPLPPKTVGITFEGAYQATLSNVMPILEDAQIPFTVFYASDMADSASSGHMGWSQLKKLHRNSLVSLGILPASYNHMAAQTADQNTADINRAVAKYRDAFDEAPLFFAYPYGEFSSSVKKIVFGYDFKAAFGSQSGGIHPHSDFMDLPRFTMTDDYGDLDHFVLTANALPLPVSDIVPEDPVLTQNPPIIGFTVSPQITNLSKLSCFASSLGKLPITQVGNNRIEIRPDQPFTDRRTRINCTLADGLTGWRWFGMLLISPSLADDTDSDTDDSDQDSEDPENQ